MHNQPEETLQKLSWQIMTYLKYRSHNVEHTRHYISTAVDNRMALKLTSKQWFKKIFIFQVFFLNQRNFRLCTRSFLSYTAYVFRVCQLLSYHTIKEQRQCQFYVNEPVKKCKTKSQNIQPNKYILNGVSNGHSVKGRDR